MQYNCSCPRHNIIRLLHILCFIYCVHCTNEQDQHKKNKKTQEKELVTHKWSCISSIILCIKLQLFVILLFIFFCTSFPPCALPSICCHNNHSSDKIFTYALVNHIKQQEQPVFWTIYHFIGKEKCTMQFFLFFSLIVAYFMLRTQICRYFYEERLRCVTVFFLYRNVI